MVGYVSTRIDTSVKLLGRKLPPVRFVSFFVLTHHHLLSIVAPPVYAALAIGYCAIQVIFLSATWQVNHSAGRQIEVMVQHSVDAGDGTRQYSYLDYRGSFTQLRLCPRGISAADHGRNCPVIWPKPSNATSPSTPRKRTESTAVTFFPATGTLDVPPYDGLTLNGVKPSSTVTLSPDCVQAIKWPYHQYVNHNLLSYILLIFL
jgi:hypothetical protein